MGEVISIEEQLTSTLATIDDVAKKLLNAAKNTNVWLLNGAMGAGKTTLVKAIMHALDSHDVTASPTFSIVNEYRTAKNESVYHFDFYRIKNEMEAYDIGTDEYFDSGNLCLIEWSEKIPSLLPETFFEIRIEIIDEQTRLIHYRNHSHG
jgi:tRNA threonylcarbamoyladenosine biosynthesis protein TsaE